MKVLWLAPYPHPLDSQAHPVPWVGALARQLSQQPGPALAVLPWRRYARASGEEFAHEGIRFI